MDDVVETIEQQIRADRRMLNRDIQELEERAQAAMDLRRQYREHAGAVLAVAFGGAVLLGAFSGREGRDEGASDHEEPRRSEGPRRSLFSAVDPSGRAGRHVSDLVGDVIDAFVGLAGMTAVAFISDVVPGFKDQFDARRRRPI
jgi:hypothetical protein